MGETTVELATIMEATNITEIMKTDHTTRANRV